MAMKKYVYISICFILLSNLLLGQETKFKSVLYINSYAVTYSWGDSVANGVIETLKKRPDVILYVEYLDTKRFGTINNPEYYQLFRKKYKNKRFDAAIVSDNAALDFLIQYKDSLLPAKPIVFCGINNPKDYKLDNSPFYGIKEGVDLDSVVHLVLQVMPKVRNLYFITDSTETSLTNLSYARKLEPKYKNKVKFLYITHISIDSLYKMAGYFQKESAIVLLDIFRDIDGTPVNSDVVMQKMASISNIPIFMDSETSFGKGIVGGIINKGRFDGQSVANLALMFIDKPGFIPENRISIPKDNYYFDYNVVEKYGINPDLLPKGSIVINHPEGFVSKYFKYFVIFLFIIAILIITNSISIVNINKRKKAEKLLKESENKLKDAQQIAKVGHWQFNFNSNKFDWSDEVYRIFGKNEKSFEPFLENFLNCIHIDDKRIVLETINNSWTNQGEHEIIYRIISENDDLKYVIHKFIMMPGSFDQPGLYGTIQDITQKRIIELELEKYKNHLESLVYERTEELEKTTGELQNSNEILASQKEKLNLTIEQLNETREQLVQSEKLVSLGVFTAGIAHEINNPVNFISTGIFALFKILDSFKEEFMNLSPKFQQDIKDIETIRDAIEKGIEKTTSIVSSLRNYTHPGDNSFVNYNLVACLKDALILLHSTYNNHVRIVEDFDAPMEIECIPGKLNQVFVNIINNAVQSITDKGEISIKAMKLDKQLVEIVIKDTGCGIDEQNIGRIFDPFYTTKEVGKGTGLGLYIVHGIIMQHKGTIEVESEVKKGTTFTIHLPISQT
jgi:two-component system, cell cycle sensor histidine kinase and response regulator CckA